MMQRARWFLNNGYSVKRTAEITSVPAEVCERIKNGWPQDSPEGLQDQERQARQIHQGQERVAAYRGEKETKTEVEQGNMISFSEAARLVRLQERVKWATREALKKDGHHKSDEAWTSVEFSMPGMFADDQRPFWTVKVYSYVLGTSRNNEWQAATLVEALAVAERDVATWVQPYEMEEFVREMQMRGYCDGPEDDSASDCVTQDAVHDVKQDDEIAF